MTLLREWIKCPSMSALINNIAASQLHLLVYKIVLSYMIRPAVSSPSSRTVLYTRQLLHMIMGSSVLFWSLYDTKDWSWRLNVLVPLVVAARLFYKGYIVASNEDIEVQLVSRSSSPSELLFGPLQFALIMVWLGLYRFQSQPAALIAAAIGIGDGMAPIIGARFGRHYYHVPFAARKTMEGSLCGVFLGTVWGTYLFSYVLGLELMPLRMILAYGFLAAVMEGTSVQGIDNVVLAVVMDSVSKWLPAF